MLTLKMKWSLAKFWKVLRGAFTFRFSKVRKPRERNFDVWSFTTIADAMRRVGIPYHSVEKSPKKSHSWKLAKIDQFWRFWGTFVHLKCKCSSLRSQCWMRLFLWFSNTVPYRESLIHCRPSITSSNPRGFTSRTKVRRQSQADLLNGWRQPFAHTHVAT